MKLIDQHFSNEKILLKNPVPDPGLEYSAMSLYAYRDRNQPSIPKPWEFYTDSDEFDLSSKEENFFGFYACVFINKAFSILLVNIVFRGTNSAKDFLQLIQIWLGKIPSYFSNHAIPFIEKVRARLKEEYPDKFVGFMFGGHSLGALIAELCVCREQDFISKPYVSTAWTYESPGSKDIVEKAVEQGIISKNAYLIGKKYVFHFFGRINVINTYREQLNTPFISQCALPVECKGAKLLPFGRPDFDIYVRIYSVEQHSMLAIYNHFKNKGPVFSNGDNWPIGIKEGFAKYKSYPYPNSSHWDHHMKACWEHDAHVRKMFEDNFRDYSEFFIKEYLTESKQEKKLFKTSKTINLMYKGYHQKYKLHSAIKSGDYEKIVRFFKENPHWDNWNLQDNEGNMPIHMVEFMPANQETAKIPALLIKYGAALGKENKQGKSGFDAMQIYLDRYSDCVENNKTGLAYITSPK